MFKLILIKATYDTLYRKLFKNKHNAITTRLPDR